MRDVFEYAVLRVVPRVERGEALNAGVLVYCRQRDYLGSRVHLDPDRLRALDPTADVAAIGRALQAAADVCAASPEAGAAGREALGSAAHTSAADCRARSMAAASAVGSSARSRSGSRCTREPR